MAHITSATSLQRVQFIPVELPEISEEIPLVHLEGCGRKPLVKSDPLPARGPSLQELVRSKSLNLRTILFGQDCKSLFRFLNNESPASFEFGDIRYSCATSAYEAQKFLNHRDIMWRMSSMDAEQAYALSAEKHLMKHPSWHSKRFETMRDILRAKFGQNPALKQMLLSTLDTYLSLHSPHKNMDPYWTNNSDGSGNNELGNLLMDVRWENGGCGRTARSVGYRDFVLSQVPQNPIPPCLDKSDADIYSEIDDLNRKIDYQEYEKNSQIGRRSENQQLGRFGCNIAPYDQTLVPLSSGRFISASFVLSKKFIGTQSPMEHTSENFWSMVWEHHVPVVIMLNRLQDPGDYIYFPFCLSDSKTYGAIHLRLTEEPHFKTDLSWRQSPHEEEPHAIIHRKVIVQRGGQERLVHHFQYQNWRDFSAGNERAAAYLVQAVNPIRIENGGPTVIHCHAGVGRTAVMMALLDQSLHLPAGTADMKRNLERQRSPDDGRTHTMMQSPEQYHFCYRVLRTIAQGNSGA